MAASAGDGGDKPNAITFPNRNIAQVAWSGPKRTVSDLLGQLELSDSRPVLLVVGGAESMDPSILTRLLVQLEKGAIQAVAATGAVILDGGTDSGIMAAVGQASADSDMSIVLAGVAPAGKVTFEGDARGDAAGNTALEPNHTHFLLANSAEWGGETSLLFGALDEMARDQPAAVLVAGGGAVALNEVEAAAGRRLPVVVIAGSGGLADILVKRHAPATVPGIDPTRVKGISESTEVIAIELGADPARLAGVLTRSLQLDETLRYAWRSQILISGAAAREQDSFRREQTVILLLGVILTMLVVANTVLDDAGWFTVVPWLKTVLYFAILVIPITVGAIVATSGRLRPGTRWVQLRGSSESLKREIYRYRVRASDYGPEQTKEASPEAKFAEAVGSAIDSLMTTDANLVALDPDADRKAARRKRRHLPRSVDDARVSSEKLTALTPGGYVQSRLDDQAGWYLDNAARLSRDSRMLQLLGILFGAIGTLFAAIGLQIWVAATTAIVGAYGTYRAIWQLETTLSRYNKAAASLGAIRLWWFALTPDERSLQSNIDKLVDGAEAVLKAEQSGWVQEMQEAITQLRLEPADGDGASRAKADGGTGGEASTSAKGSGHADAPKAKKDADDEPRDQAEADPAP